MIRVLQVLGSLQRGGAETFVMNVYRRIDRTRIQFDFLVKERVDDGYEQEALDLGAHIYQVESAKKIGSLAYIDRQSDVMRGKGRYDAVHAHVNYLSGLTLIAAKKAGIENRIAHSHSTNFPAGIGERLSKAAIVPVSTKLFACSEDSGRALFGGANFQIIGNGIEWQRFAKASIKNNGQKLNIVQIGRFVEVKNHRFTLEVLKALKQSDKLSNVTLTFLGDGPTRLEIEQMSRKFGLSERVVFAGSVASPEEWLGKADMAIMPSLYEGIPLSAIEAQCASCETLLSDRINREVDLGLGNCRFIPLDEKVWAESISQLLAKKTPLSNKAIESAIIAKGFSPDIAAEILTEYYEGLV